MRRLSLRFVSSVEPPQKKQPCHSVRQTLREPEFQKPSEPPEPEFPPVHEVEESGKAMRLIKEIAEYERGKKAAISSS